MDFLALGATVAREGARVERGGEEERAAAGGELLKRECREKGELLMLSREMKNERE